METKRDYLINHLRKCERESISLASHCLLVWQYWRGLVRTKTLRLKLGYALTAILTIQNAFRFRFRHLSQNRRKFVGFVMLGAGVVSYFAGSLFFDPLVYDHAPCRLFGLTAQCYNFDTQEGWCFISWYLYFDNLGWAVALIFISLAIALLLPSSLKNLNIAIAIPMQAIGWMKMLHVSFFARSHETYTAFPAAEIIFIAVCLAVAIVLSADYLIHTYNHRTRAFESRLGTLYNGLDLLDGDTFKEQYRKFYEEKQEFTKQF